MNEKLSEAEWKFCKKLQEKIASMKSITKAQRNEVITFIKKSCKDKKYDGEINILPNNPEGEELWEFKLNNKKNFLYFNLFDNGKPIILPSNTFEVNIL